jgi:hypothetical protein
MMSSPYQNLPKRSFWRSAVAERNGPGYPDIYRKKFDLKPTDKIATAGSCFAQHIARHLRKRAFTVLDLEPAFHLTSQATAHSFGYGLYSARYGNIYTARQLHQLCLEAIGKHQPAISVWKKDDRYFDALRPSVEPQGLASPEEVAEHRKAHLKFVRKLLETADVFVFTLGLTEAWIHTDSGTVYPTAPGTIAGSFDPAVFEFKNFTYGEVYSDIELFWQLIKEINPKIRMILTVSPVPLTATAGSEHVLAATTYSKSVLRAAAGCFAAQNRDVDYFPSYEIISGFPSKAAFFEDNCRNVTDTGVETVMEIFFGQHGNAGAAQEDLKPPPSPARSPSPSDDEDVVCEEQLLEAFAP